MKKNQLLLQSSRCVLFLAGFGLLALLLHTDFIHLSKWWSIIASIINLITILILLNVCKKREITYRELIAYKKRSTKFLDVVLITIIVLFVGMGGMYLAGFISYGKFPYMATMMIQPIPVWLAIINILVLPITTTLAEDGLYLGAGVNQIENKWCAIFVPAFFYAFQHSFIPTVFDIQYIIYRFLSFIPLTLIMCYVYYRKRNPVPFMIGHFVINIATAAQIIVTSASPELFELMKNM